MVVLGLLVLSAPPQPMGGRVAPLALCALLGLATLPIIGNQLLVLVGAAPLSSADCVAIADRTLAEGDAGQAGRSRCSIVPSTAPRQTATPTRRSPTPRPGAEATAIEPRWR
jgi:hypothetical protein